MTAPRRERYLALRREGSTHDEACAKMDLACFTLQAKQYASWYEAESVVPAPPRRKPSFSLPPLMR